MPERALDPLAGAIAVERVAEHRHVASLASSSDEDQVTLLPAL